jgi:hypothetical protein
MMVANLTAFLPTFVDKNDWAVVNGVSTNVNTDDISYIIAAFSAAQVIFSPFNT